MMWRALVLVLLASAPSFASHALARDSYAREVAIDTPSAWWRMEDQNVHCQECVFLQSSPASSCKPQPSCYGAVRGQVTFDSPGWGLDSGKSVVFTGIGWLQLPRGWREGQGGADYTVELFLRPDATGYDGEQTVVAGGAVRLCDRVGREGCVLSQSEAKSGGFEILLMRDLGAANSFRLGARVQMRGQPDQLGAAELWGPETSLLLAGQWYHVTLTVTSTLGLLYVNAGLHAQARMDGRVPWDGAALVIGGPVSMGVTGGYLRGHVDDVAVYPHALAHTRIAMHYARTFSTEEILSPHSACSSPPQTHTNLVQGCEEAQVGIKRALGRGNVASDDSATAAPRYEDPDFGSGYFIQGPNPWPVNSIHAQ